MVSFLLHYHVSATRIALPLWWWMARSKGCLECTLKTLCLKRFSVRVPAEIIPICWISVVNCILTTDFHIVCTWDCNTAFREVWKLSTVYCIMCIMHAFCYALSTGYWHLLLRDCSAALRHPRTISTAGLLLIFCYWKMLSVTLHQTNGDIKDNQN